jgi:hypothetical protein
MALRPAPDHLHRLVAGHRAQRVDVILGGEQLPEAIGAAAGEAVLDRNRAAKPADLVRRIGALDSGKSAGGSGIRLLKSVMWALEVDELHR